MIGAAALNSTTAAAQGLSPTDPRRFECQNRLHLRGGGEPYNMELCDLRGRNLRNAHLDGANLTGVRWFNTHCPDGRVQSTLCQVRAVTPAAVTPATATPATATPATAPEGCGQMQSNAEIARGRSIFSCGGGFRLVVQADDGNVVLLNAENRPVWATARGGHLLSMQGDGDLVLLDAARSPVGWASATDGNPGATLRLGDNGRLAIHNAAGAEIRALYTPSVQQPSIYAYESSGLEPMPLG